MAKLYVELANLRESGVVASSDTTLETFRRSCFEESAEGHNVPATVEWCRGMVKKYIIPVIGRHRVSKLDQSRVQGMLNRMSAAGLSTRTVAFIRAAPRNPARRAPAGCCCA